MKLWGLQGSALKSLERGGGSWTETDWGDALLHFKLCLPIKES